MKKEISVYELLGLIKDGKAPQKIKEYQSDGRTERYCLNEKGWYTTFDGTTDMNLFIKERLNGKVEILEEDKPIIEKIGKIYDGFTDSYYDTCLETTIKKVDEIIDVVNKLKKEK